MIAKTMPSRLFFGQTRARILRRPHVIGMPRLSPQHSHQPHQPHKLFSTTPGRMSSYPAGSSSPTGPTASARKVTIATLGRMHSRGERISMVTAYDYPTGLAADAAGVDVVLVGDSCAMVALGMEDTTDITVDEMAHHSRAVARAVKRAFIAVDLPFGSFESSSEKAVESAIRLVKHGRAHGVKIEGGRAVAGTISQIVHSAGIPVIGHVGLTPQRLHALGGFRSQAKTAAAAAALLDDALAVQAAGAFAIVIEAVAAPVAAIVSAKLRVPTIGIGAGIGCSGQVLVQTDLVGALPGSADVASSTYPLPDHHLPKFVRQYAHTWSTTVDAISQYHADVKAGRFPGPEHEYSLPDDQLAEFAAMSATLPADPHHHHHPTAAVGVAVGKRQSSY